MPRMITKDRDPLRTEKGKRPGERSMEELLAAGVINLDKPVGPTSHQVTAWVRDILGVERIGHGGTLDPKVSGVLPIALGKATKATDLVLRSDKEYVCLMILHRDVAEDKLRRVLGSFVGDIYQVPPVRAAVKRQLRVRRVHSINVLQVKGREVLFQVECDAGTYIRTLCVDVGDALGIGAHMEELRRTRSGSMRERESVQLQDLKDAFVYWKEGDESHLRRMVAPMEVLLDPLPKVVLKDSAVDAVCHGADLAVVGIAKHDASIARGDLAALMTQKGEGVALGVALMSGEEMGRAREGIALSTDRVFMEPGTYPKMWESAEERKPAQ
ncbi:MAG TPA: RNA-guided pseudouridylation complex pseudouridine synthase subunit Cbf5 [Methanomassiliicoccales archaeon]|nr:RNA-guided pseudouridylation complex pseudouridine synthase subunit Cbf5 [Methanomassiliicoccales archaeon]